MQLPPIGLILASVVSGVLGQLLLKAGMSRLGPLDVRERGVVGVAQRIGSIPSVWAGFGLYGLSMVLWLVALSSVELGYAYPFISLSYVLILFGSRAFFKERLSPARLLGVAAICLGVYAVAGG